MNVREPFPGSCQHNKECEMKGSNPVLTEIQVFWDIML
jgi:hypothetical protein